MGDRRYSQRYDNNKDFDGQELARGYVQTSPLQRYADLGRRLPYSFDGTFDLPEPSRGSAPRDRFALPACPPWVPSSRAPPIPTRTGRPQRLELFIRRREEQELRAALEASAREAREAQERRDAEEAARLDALERQIAEDLAYAQALQYEASSDSGDSNVATLQDRTIVNERPCTNETSVFENVLVMSPEPTEQIGHSYRRNMIDTMTDLSSFTIPNLKTERGKKQSLGSITSSIHAHQTFDCAVCFNTYEYHTNKIARLPCDHCYCTECLSELFTGAISGAISRLSPQPFPPTCCKDHPILYKTMRPWLNVKVIKNYIRHRAILETPIEERVWCGRDDCGEFIAPQRSAVTTGIFEYRFADGKRMLDDPSRASSSSNTLVHCTACLTQTCTQCKRLADEHTGGAGGVCPEDPEVKQLMSTAQQRGWQQCYRCKSMVEKTDGCNYMTCTCRAQFCYVCGQRWQNRHCDHGRCNCGAEFCYRCGQRYHGHECPGNNEEDDEDYDEDDESYDEDEEQE